MSAWAEAMRREDFATAWTISDAVLAARDHRGRDDPSLPYHERWVWDGTPVEGRHVLVRCYHGLGDTLQFARFLPMLAKRAGSVTVEAQPPLLPVLETLSANLDLRPFDPRAPSRSTDVDVEIMELGHVLRARPDDAPAPYLRAAGDPLAAGAFALCWRAGDWDPLRSIPVDALIEALPVQSHVSLQHGAAAAEGDRAWFRNPGDASGSILRTAALLAGAAGVVTVDTMVAHLAGALGCPGVVLLRRDADWRWGRGERTTWYPCLHLLRQDRPNDWTGPLSMLRDVVQRSPKTAHIA